MDTHVAEQPAACELVDPKQAGIVRVATPAVATRSSDGENATPAAPALTGERRMRTMRRVATFHTTVLGALPVTASRRPSWLKASETT